MAGGVFYVQERTKSQMNLVIKNTEPRLVILPGLPAVHDKKGKVTATAWSEHRLAPGENDVDSRYWERVVKKSGVKIFLAAGLIKNTGEGKAELMVLSLDKLTGRDAAVHIGKCNSIQLLNEWKASTESTVMRQAIAERIQELIASADGAAPEATEESAGTVQAVVEATVE